MINNYTFKGDQEAAFELLLKFIANFTDLTAALIGYAGTGKTYLIGCLADAIQRQTGKRVCIAAPTHQAKNELLSKITLQGITVDAHTSAGLIGMAPDESIEDFDPNNPYFAPKFESKVKDYDVILHDEASMLPKVYYEYLVGEARKQGVQIIFVGDDAQLPPVGDEQDSPALVQKITAVLETVIRQTKSNPLSYLLLGMRMDIDFHRNREVSQKVIDSFNDLYTGNQPIQIVPGSMTKQLFKLREHMNEDGGFKLVESFDQYYQRIADQVKEGLTTNNLHRARVLAFRNVNVEAHARRVRKILAPDATAPFVVGDLLIGYRTIRDANMNIGIMNSRVYKIINVSMVTDIHGYDVFNVVFSDGLESTFIDPSNYSRYLDEYTKRLRDAKGKGRKWGQYWGFRNGYLLIESLNKKHNRKDYPSKDMDYAYASTVHKAQGSTYSTVLIDVPDIKALIAIDNGSKLNFYRTLYVAASRASNRAYFVV